MRDRLLAAVSGWEWVVFGAAAAAILASVAAKFLEKAEAGEAPAERERSVVATLTMTAFFLLVFVLARRGIGRIGLGDGAGLAARLSGSFLAVAGAALNVAARLVIGRQWSDAIEVQRDHRVVRAWPYSWCRHPMYGSLVVFGVGLGFLSANPAAIAAVVAVFVPAMAHRARREEALLARTLGAEYEEYRRDRALLVPRLPEAAVRPLRGALGGMVLAAILARDPEIALVAAALTLGLSFAMARADFRIAYKAKAALTAAQAVVAPPLLWIPVAASAVSLTGRCPGTMIVNVLRGKARDAT